MENLLDGVRKSTESANELIDLLKWIAEECSLNNDEIEGVQDDIESINNVVQLLQQALSKEQIREVWNLIQRISHEFGGYVGGKIGVKLNKAFNKLWEDLLNLVADSQDIGS